MNRLKELRGLLKNRLFLVGLGILLPLVVVAVLANVVAPYDPLKLELFNSLAAPSKTHLLGTDEFGRDLLSRLMYGARLSLGVGALTAAMACIVGLVVGSLAGYYRKLDSVLMRIMDGLMAFPGILLAIMIVSAIGPSVFNVIVAMTIIYSPRITRIVRSTVIEAKVQPYIDAARIVGLRDIRIIFSHILPNCLAPIIVQTSFCFAWALLVEASLTFIGLGTPPPTASLGSIIADGRDFIRTCPWLVISPGVVISAAVMGLNLIGDGLRDFLDPKMRYVRK
jgi:peptide/nickel transport system permease protein